MSYAHPPGRTARSRRDFLRTAAVAVIATAAYVGLMTGVPRALAADYPSQPVTIVVPQGPGGLNDIVARQIAASLGEIMGGSFVVLNRAGAGGSIGTEFAARAKPDGYTLLLTITPHVVNPVLYKTVGYDPIKDFEPIALLAVVPMVLVANPSFPANTLPELIALAKKEPGKIPYATGGNGTLPHIAGEKLKIDAGIDLTHVPYRAVAPAIVDTIAGTTPLVFATVPAALQHINGGKLKALGVTGAARSAALPNVPTFGETLPGYSMDNWVGLFAVAGTPRPIVDALSKAVTKALESDAIKKQFAAQGAELQIGTPDSFAARVKADFALYKDVVPRSGAKVD